MSVKITKRKINDVTVLKLAGRLTLGEASGQVRDALHELIDRGEKKIVLNLGEVSYIDSAGLGELVSSFTRVRSSGGELKLANLELKVRDLLELTKLSTLFEVFPNEAAAIQSLG